MTRSNATVMAFDYGLRNIGVAVGNRKLGTSQPLAIIAAKDGKPNWEQVSACLQEWRPGLLIVGDPINMDGTESEMSQRAKRFARQLEGRFQYEVVLVDERLTSRQAKIDAREAGHRGNYQRKPIDADAANLILGGWLSENS